MGYTIDTTPVMLRDLKAELARQDEKFGEQNHEDGTAPDLSFFGQNAKDALHCVRQELDHRNNVGRRLYIKEGDLREYSAPPIWALILLEEVLEALVETDPVELSKELNQVAAVCLQWRKAIERRKTECLAVARGELG